MTLLTAAEHVASKPSELLGCRPPGRLVALLPAHDEEANLAAAIASLRSQTTPPDDIVVLADNCQDRTAEVAAREGATVYVTRDNRHRKAGALNQALHALLPHLDPTDHVLCMDADSVLCSDWCEKALTALTANPGIGAVSGAYVARRGRGFVTLLQRAEYAQERRRIARREGRVDVLSGTSVLFPAHLLQTLVRNRGYAYDERSWTEDFEITLAVQSLGYEPRCYSDLHVVTDVMETWRSLATQRIRWQRGTTETLCAYGWTPLTRRLWATQVLTYSSTLVTLAVLASWTATAVLGVNPDWRWLLVLPVFMADQAVATRKAGWAPTLVSVLLVPMWLYDGFRLAIYWIALGQSLRRTDAAWA